MRRRFALVALLVAVHAPAVPLLALAEAPKPSGVAKQGQDLIARGQALFEDQQYEESIQTLSGALVRPNNTTLQKLEIYRLLALNYITLQHREEAEAAVRGLLALEPTYELPRSESPRFRDFFAAAKQKWEAEGRPGLVKPAEAPPAPVTMKHSSPSEADGGKQIDLTATLEDPQSRVAQVKLFYRTGSKGVFEEAVASLEDKRATAAIPPGAVKAPLVEYYLQGLDKGGLPIVSRGDAAAPLRIPVQEGGGGWVLPVAIGGGVAAVAGVVAAVVLATRTTTAAHTPPGTPTTGPTGTGNPAPGQGVVNVSVGSSGIGPRW